MSTVCLIIIAQYFLCLQFPAHGRGIWIAAALVGVLYALVKLGEWAQDFNHKTALKKKVYEKIAREIDGGCDENKQQELSAADYD